MIRLYTFNISHFAEKARWALDRTGIAYEEKVLLPGLHVGTIKRLGQGATSVPALVDGERAVQGSTAILDHVDERWLAADQKLTPAEPELAARVRELEQWLDAEIGEAGRRFFYHHALPHKKFVAPLMAQRGPWWGGMFFGLAYPKVAQAIRGMYRITAETAAADGERLLAAYRRLDEMLAQGPYLVGDRFTRADLTLAALTAPVWRPPEHPTRWPDEQLLPDEVRRWRDEMAKFRVRDHTLRVYREHRQGQAARSSRAAAS